MAIGELFSKITDFYRNRYTELAGFQKPDRIPDGSEIVHYLAEVPDYVYARYGFNREPLKGRLADDERDQLLFQCIEEGTKYASALKKQYPDLRPAEIAERLGITVYRPKMPSGGGHVRFAEFEQPNKIRVFLDAFDKAEELIRECGEDKFFAKISLEDVLIAHELYHFVEMINGDEIFTQNKQIELWGVGKLKYRSKLVSLPEITAMSFAKELTGLPFSAYFFDVFLTYSYNKELGTVIFNEIKKLNETNAQSSHEEV